MPDLTLGAAMLAGLLSFLSPCVLPVVPAYLAQLGAVSVAAPAFPRPAAATELAVAGGPPLPKPSATTASAPRTRWTVLPHALAFVLGFTAIFTLLGVTATYAGGALGRDLPFLRQVGGVVLVILGLNMAGVIRIPFLMRTWRPLDANATRMEPAPQRTVFGAFGLGSIFALGWTPCIGPTLGGILGLSVFGPTPQLGLLFVAYSLGLGIPFVAMALAVDHARAVTRPLLRYGRQMELLAGALVALIGLAIIFDWLGFFARSFNFLWPQV